MPVLPVDLAHPKYLLLGDLDAPALGKESYLEFNELLLHDRRYSDYFHIDRLDGLQDADIIDVREIRPDDDGEDEGDDENRVSGRTIVITGHIVCGNISRLREMQWLLRQAFDKRTHDLVFHSPAGRPSIKIACRKTGRIEGIEEQADLRARREFQITLRAADPYFVGTVEKSITLIPTAVTQLARVYPTLYRYASPDPGGQATRRYDAYVDTTMHLAPAPQAGTATNSGDAPARVTADLQGLLGTPELVNRETEDRLKFRRDVPAGAVYFFDDREGILEDQGGYNRYGAMDTSLSTSSFLIAPSDNLIDLRVASFDGNAQVTLRWRDTYR